MITIGIMTLGCRVNQYESQAISEKLENMGYKIMPFSSACDVYIINTCSVTSEGDRKSRQMIGRALSRKVQNPNIIVVAIGCFTQNKKQSGRENDLFKLGDIDFIGGNTDKSKIPDLLNDYILSNRHEKINVLQNIDQTRKFDDISLKKSSNVRAYLKVQDGCNNFCTYCIVPIVRGRVRSKPLEIVIKDLAALKKAGYKEVVFCGIELSAYGEDSGVSIINLVKCADEQGFARVRFGSLNPSLFSDIFTKELSLFRCIMPHFHLSVQSASSDILLRMGRNYNEEILTNAVKNIKKYFLSSTLSCDIICGFPGESHDDFNQTFEFVKKNDIIHAHIFPYSKREGTPAASMPNQLATSQKKERCSSLSVCADERMKNVFSSYIDTEQTVLIESKKDSFSFGYTENFLPVAIVRDYEIGTLVSLKLKDDFKIVGDEFSFIVS